MERKAKPLVFFGRLIENPSHLLGSIYTRKTSSFFHLGIDYFHRSVKLFPVLEIPLTQTKKLVQK